MNPPASKPRILAACALVGVALLVGCSSSAPESDDSGDSSNGSESTGGGASGGKDCSGLKDSEFELFVDPSLEVEPALEVYPLQSESDTITFTYTGDMSVGPGFSFSSYYITEEGKASPAGGQPAFDLTDDGVFSISGPEYTAGIAGAPPGILVVEMVTNARFDDEKQTYTADTVELAHLCMVFAE